MIALRPSETTSELGSVGLRRFNRAARMPVVRPTASMPVAQRWQTDALAEEADPRQASAAGKLPTPGYIILNSTECGVSHRLAFISLLFHTCVDHARYSTPHHGSAAIVRVRLRAAKVPLPECPERERAHRADRVACAAV